MLNSNILSELEDILGTDNVRKDEPMYKHTTFRIGGAADCFVTPDSIDKLKKVVLLLKDNNIDYYIVGNGSNLLVNDNGYRGVIIQLYNQFSKYEFLHDSCNSAVDKPDRVYVKVQAGMMLSKLGKIFADNSLTGFEFATGIPGTIGGAVMMNAGAYGGEFKDIIISADVMDREGNIFTLSCDELELGYRTSIIAKKNYIVLAALIGPSAGNKDKINERLKELANMRREKQPLEYPSAGSTFKRPKGYFAGKLISDAGLKGLCVGDAQVSEKHAGFVINKGHATAKDVIELTDKVSDKVYGLNGVRLELEVRKLGF